MERVESSRLQSGVYLVDYAGNDGSSDQQRIVITH
jgi:hypothetical protein